MTAPIEGEGDGEKHRRLMPIGVDEVAGPGDYPTNGPAPFTTVEEWGRFEVAFALDENGPIGDDPPAPPGPDEVEGFNDIGNADRLHRLHQPRLRFVHAFGSWLVWEGTRWQKDPGNVLAAELAKEISVDLYRQVAELAEAGAHVDDLKRLTRWAEQSANRSRIDAAIHLARGMPGILTSHEELDADPWALNVANGWIDLRTGTFHRPDPAKLFTMQAPVRWDPGAVAPLWERCLTEWLPDPEDRDWFQRLCGASVVGAIKDHLLVLIWGPGANGKGTAIGALAKTLGEYFVVPHKSLLVTHRHEQHATVKATLFRARLAVAAETEKRIALNEAQIKELTGGDRIAARRMYENEWSFWPTHTLWLQTNHLPEVAGRDHGIWRRIKVLPWLTTFTGDGDDRDLGEKLAHETPGILRWLVEGALRWQRKGLTEPDSVRRATADYRRAEDLIDRWLTDTGLVIGPDLNIAGTDLADSWKQWTETTFGRARRFNETAGELERMGCGKYRNAERTALGKQRQITMWHGIGWGPLTAVDPCAINSDGDPFIRDFTAEGLTGVHTTGEAQQIPDISDAPDACAECGHRIPREHFDGCSALDVPDDDWRIL